MRALANLVTNDKNRECVGAAKGLSTILESAKQHADSAEVQAGVSGALRNLSISPTLAAKMMENGAISILVGALEKHSTSGIVLHGAAGGLRNLAVDPKNRKKVVDAGGVTALDKVIGAHAENEQLKNELQYARSVILGEKPPPEAVAAAMEAAKRKKSSSRKSERSQSPLLRALTSGKKLLSGAKSGKSLAQENGGPHVSAAPAAEAPKEGDGKKAKGGFFGWGKKKKK